MSATGSAQTPGATPQTIRVTGRATAQASPDQAEIDLGVVTRSETSQRASADNARQFDVVLTSLRKQFPTATIRSIAYSVQPEYSRPSGNDEPRITGYTATNIVRVTLDDVTKVGGLVDAATATGANRVQRIEFSLKKEDAVRGQALRDAAISARAQADALASALGLRIVRVLSAADESGPIVRPFAETAQFARAGAAAAPTPIEAGPIEVTASVTLVVEVAAP